jgi:hypothetical protein
MLHCAVSQKLTGISEVLTAATIRAMMFINFYKTTERNISEDDHLHTCCHEKLKSHLVDLVPDTEEENCSHCVRMHTHLSRNPNFLPFKTFGNMNSMQ